MDWDDVRFFLATSRGGSVRAAAAQLGVNHATVLRRIGQLEARLGAALFEKLPAGYRLTAAGADILASAEQMEAASLRMETRVFGRDQAVRGLLRVALPPPLATHLLMPDFADFARLHPEIEMEIIPGDAPVNLTNRQADVAIRVVFDRSTLGANLHGLKGPEVMGSVYLARRLLADWQAGETEAVRWVAHGQGGPSERARKNDVPVSDIPFRALESAALIAAVRAGAGMAALPCFVGDADAGMARAPGAGQWLFGTIWLLTQGEARKTRRVRLFIDFIARRLAAHAPLLAGDVG